MCIADGRGDNRFTEPDDGRSQDFLLTRQELRNQSFFRETFQDETSAEIDGPGDFVYRQETFVFDHNRNTFTAFDGEGEDRMVLDSKRPCLFLFDVSTSISRVEPQRVIPIVCHHEWFCVGHPFVSIEFVFGILYPRAVIDRGQRDSHVANKNPAFHLPYQGTGRKWWDDIGDMIFPNELGPASADDLTSFEFVEPVRVEVADVHTC